LRALPAGLPGRRGTEAGPVSGLRRAERRKQILDAATQAFARSGFVTTSLDEVAAEAGITHVILYRRLDCKAGMYRAMRDHAYTRLASTAAHGECIEVLSWLFHLLAVGVKRVCVVTDLDVVCNGTDTGEVGEHFFCRGPLRAAAHRSGERDLAVLCHRLHPCNPQCGLGSARRSPWRSGSGRRVVARSPGSCACG